jgi:hypothetical protein
MADKNEKDTTKDEKKDGFSAKDANRDSGKKIDPDEEEKQEEFERGISEEDQNRLRDSAESARRRRRGGGN